MSVVTSATITQSAGGLVLTYTDTTTGLVGTITRTLSVYDPDGTYLGSPAFTDVTATFDITADGWFSFQEVITDDNGTYYQTVNYLSTTFYQNTFSNAIADLGCPDNDFTGNLFNLNLSQDYYQAALRFFIGGFGVAAQNMITQANFYATTPYYA